MIGDKGSPSTDNNGRIELFKGGKWGSICSKGFNDKSAGVACKQMGFDGGSIIGEASAFKACDTGEANYCATDSSEIILTNV